jgi:hypothetical protein
MKRETRPFIVEVRRGSKKQSAPFLPPPPEAQQAEKGSAQRAEEILFSREQGENGSHPPRKGRILEPVLEPPATEAEAPELPAEPPRRRGRPPGSKNRPAESGEKSEHPGPGRPRLAPEVRRLQLTPELVNAAMETITKISPAQDSMKTPPRGPSPQDQPEESLGAAKKPRRKPPVARRQAPTDQGRPEQLPLELRHEPEAPRPARQNIPRAARFAAHEEGLQGLARSDLRCLFKPGERWKGRMRLRALARRRRSS